MPFRALLRFRNPDLTTDINRRFQDLIDKGVFYGGEVLPVAGALQVQVQPFGAVGADGMVTVLESTPEIVGVVANATQYVVLHAEYVPNALPTVELEALSQTAYDALTDEQKRVRVRLATVTVPLGATEVTAAQISTVDADKVDPLSRSSFRGVVEDEADLPDYTDPATGETTQNRPDDLYFVSNQRIFYHWNTLGTPQWAPVIAAATELALQNHKLNQDDGTAFPDFIEAQHIGVAQRQAFDVGSASVAKHGSAGTAFGTTNGLVDAQYPVAVTERVDLTGLIGVTAVQLVGTFYVGTGGIGTAAQYFRLSEYQADRQLVGSDRGPIVVDQIWNSANVSQLVPSVDADDLGFYQNPWVQLSFASTIDGAFTGSMTVVANRKQTLGTMDIDALAIPRQPVGLSGQAADIPLIGGGFTTIPTATADVQAAFDFIDTQLTSLGATPNELNWYGFQPSPISTLTGNASVSIWESKNGTHILLDSTTDEVYIGRGLTDAVIIKGFSVGETLLPRGSVATVASAIKGKDSGHLFIDLQNNDGLDGVAFRYDSTNTAGAPDKIALSIQGNSGSARVFVNDYNALSPDRNFAVVGSGRFNRTGATYLQGIDLISDATNNRILGVSEEADKKHFLFYSVYESTGAPSGTVGFDWLLGDAGAPTTVMAISETGAGYVRSTGSSVTAAAPYLWTFAGVGTDYDVRVSSVTPGLVLEDSTGYDFRIGAQSNVFSLSVDTDNDNARDANQNFDDLVALTISGTGYLEQFCNTRLGATLDSSVDLAKFSGEAAPTALSDISSLVVRQYRHAPLDILYPGADAFWFSSIDLSRYVESTEVARIRMSARNAFDDNEISLGVNTPSGFRSPLTVRADGSVFLVASNPTSVSDSLLELFGQDGGGVNDIGMRAYSPGVRFESTLGSETSRFRWGAYSNELHLSIDTDDDGVQSDPSGHYDDLPNGIVVTAAGDVGVGTVPSTKFHVVSGAVAGLTYTDLDFVFEGSGSSCEMALMGSTTGVCALSFHDTGGRRAGLDYNHLTDTLTVFGAGYNSTLDMTATTLEYNTRYVVVHEAGTANSFTKSTVTTTNQTQLLYTIPAGLLRTASTIRIRVGGRITDVGTATGVELNILVGGTTTEWVNTISIDTVSPATGQHFWLDAEARYNSSGIDPSVQRLITGGFAGEVLRVGCLSGNVADFDPSTNTAIYFAVKTASGTLNGIQVNFVKIDFAV